SYSIEYRILTRYIRLQLHVPATPSPTPRTRTHDLPCPHLVPIHPLCAFSPPPSLPSPSHGREHGQPRRLQRPLVRRLLRARRRYAERRQEREPRALQCAGVLRVGLGVGLRLRRHWGARHGAVVSRVHGVARRCAGWIGEARRRGRRLHAGDVEIWVVRADERPPEGHAPRRCAPALAFWEWGRRHG
ncbi:hypothetical protein BV25DRAFT_1165318, partial [Artomyces pyxidatus]